MRVSYSRILAFRRRIFTWWRLHRRDLPWRRTYDPYRILVSEIMLQQTQVARVIPKYQEFLTAFPTAGALARAPLASVLRAWRGMGYNRRALYLRETARAVFRKYGGMFPETEEELVQLPGLGTYTARALLVFAFRKHAAPVDTNIRRIITHFFFGDRDQSASVIQALAIRLVPQGKAWEWHQALMDYGALALPRETAVPRKRKRTVPFRQSNRFYRGRVIDLLREGKKKEADVVRYVTDLSGNDDHFAEGIISSLSEDGLLVREAKGVVMLPDVND